MTFSLIIPTLGRPEGLKIVFDSLVNQTFEDFEVIVINAGDFSSVQKVVDQYQNRLQIIHEPQRYGKNLVGATIQGYEIMHGEIFIRHDDDNKSEPQWLEEIKKTFDSDPQIGGVTGPTIIPLEKHKDRDLTAFNQKFETAKNPIWKLIGFVYKHVVMEGNPKAIGKFYKSGAFGIGSNFEESKNLPGNVESDYLEACNWCMYKRLMEQIGGFDKAFGGAAEFYENDISFKVRKLGYKLIFNPKAVVYHLPSSVGAFSARSDTGSRIDNFLRFYFRHFGWGNLEQTFRFLTYLLMQNGYYTYVFLLSHDKRLLNCWGATVRGIFNSFG